MNIKLLAAALLFSALLPSVCRADDSDNLIEQVAEKNSNAKTRTGNFVEERKRSGKQAQSLEGKLTFNPAGYLTMNYSKPEGEYFIIEDGSLSMKSGGAENRFDLSRNKPMKTLSDLLIASFSGKLQEFAAVNSCVLSAQKTANAVRIILCATKKAVKGYSKVTVDYDPKTFLLSSMIMEEFDGSVTTYKMK